MEGYDYTYFGKKKGKTLMNLNTMMLLEIQMMRVANKYGTKESAEVSSLIPVGGILSEIPLRAAINAPEYYGGVRVPNVRGHGDVVCQSDQIDDIYMNTKANDEKRVQDIIHMTEDEHSDRYQSWFWDKNDLKRFLDIFDQPYDDLKKEVKEHPEKFKLGVPKSKHDLSQPMQPFELYGRDPIWPEDKRLGRASIMSKLL